MHNVKGKEAGGQGAATLVTEPDSLSLSHTHTQTHTHTHSHTHRKRVKKITHTFFLLNVAADIVIPVGQKTFNTSTVPPTHTHTRARAHARTHIHTHCRQDGVFVFFSNILKL